ncbi:MAG: Phenylacetic acid catabolic protein [Halobacteriota archaeon]
MSEWPDGAGDYVQSIADTKLVLSQRYAEWMLSAPVLEDDIAGASAAQDELGHVRQLFRLLGEQGREDDWLEGNRDPTEFANVAAIDSTPATWPAFVVTVGLAERATWYLLDAIDHPDFDGLGTRIGQDEFFHLEFLDGRLETLIETDPDAVVDALETALPPVLAYLGPTDYDEGSDPLVESGFTDRSASALRDAFEEQYAAILSDTDVDLDALDVDWDAPDLTIWNETRRRTGAGSISESDVEALSGVRNAEFAME